MGQTHGTIGSGESYESFTHTLSDTLWILQYPPSRDESWESTTGSTPGYFLCILEISQFIFGARQTESPCGVPAFSVAHWEQLQQEKQELECRFKADLQGLRAQQRRELGALEERLKAQHMAETESLHGQHQSELEELQFQQQEQVGADTSMEACRQCCEILSQESCK